MRDSMDFGMVGMGGWGRQASKNPAGDRLAGQCGIMVFADEDVFAGGMGGSAGGSWVLDRNDAGSKEKKGVWLGDAVVGSWVGMVNGKRASVG